MRPYLAVTLVATTLGLAAMTAPVVAQDSQDTLETIRTITVNGEGEVEMAPDMATISIGVQHDAEVAADALDAASAATAAILATLDAEGIATEDIQTGAVNLSPRYSSSPLSSGNVITGYQAINSVIVTVDDLDRLGGLLATVVGDGANRLDGVSFGLQDPDAAEDEARRRAVAEGARRAVLYAEAAGVPLGDLIQLNEGGTSGVQPLRAQPMMLEMADAAPKYDVPVSAGEITVTAFVTMIYGIAE